MLFLATCLLHSFCFANKIDSLLTNEEVEKFTARYVSKGYFGSYHKFQLSPPDSLFYDTFAGEWDPAPNWKKIDFDQDGLTDLFVVLYLTDTINRKGIYTSHVFFGNDHGNYRHVPIALDHFLFPQLVKPALINNEAHLIYRHLVLQYSANEIPGERDTINGMILPGRRDTIIEILQTDTLVYKFGDFINMNSTHTYSPEIASIHFETYICYGGCPVFYLSIQKNGNTFLQKKETIFLDHDPAMKPGKFKGTIHAAQWNEIKELIHYINITTLKDSYESNALHQRSGRLKIAFTDGSSKTISDYGLKGNFSLRLLYDWLYRLRENQVWKKIK